MDTFKISPKTRDKLLATVRDGCYEFLKKYESVSAEAEAVSCSLVGQLIRNIYLLNIFSIEVDHLFNFEYRKIFEPDRLSRGRAVPEDLALSIIRGKASNNFKGVYTLRELPENASLIQLFGLETVLTQLSKQPFLDNTMRLNLIFDLRPYSTNQSLNSNQPIDPGLHTKMIEICEKLSLNSKNGIGPLRGGELNIQPEYQNLTRLEIQNQHQQIVAGVIRESWRNTDILFKEKSFPRTLTGLYANLVIRSVTIRDLLISRSSFLLTENREELKNAQEGLQHFFLLVNTFEKIVVEDIWMERKFTTPKKKRKRRFLSTFLILLIKKFENLLKPL